MAEQAQKVGDRIAEERKKRDWSRPELARRMPGVSTGNDVYRWENGKHMPRADTLEALAGVFEITVADLHSGPAGDEAAREGETAATESEATGDLRQIHVELRALRQELLAEIGKVRTAQAALLRRQESDGRSSGRSRK